MMPVVQHDFIQPGERQFRKLTSHLGLRVMLHPAVGDHLRAGRVILGRFRLERYLGHGGMGTVWEARHLSLETQIAIKFLNEELSRRQDVLARFAGEATSAARIRSPYVVSILDSGFTEDGQGFIAMELLRGEDLSRRLARVGKLTVGETSLLVTQISRGLAKAHAVNVVHRDLKPENIFVIDEEEAFAIKILDFGIAKSIGSEVATHKTDTGQLLGTPLYMSPEQALGRPLDSRSDLYSLAVLAYRCLTGRPPFVYPAVGELIVAVSTHVAPPPSQFNSALPSSLDDWFRAALAKDPGERICQTALEVADSFKRACGAALDNHQPSSGRLRVSAAKSSVPPPARTDTEEAPIPSAEETATTISARQLAVGWRASGPPAKRPMNWRMRALLALAAASTGIAGFGFFNKKSEAEDRVVRSSLAPALTAPSPAPTAPPAATNTTAAELPQPSTTESARLSPPVATSSPNAPSQRLKVASAASGASSTPEQPVARPTAASAASSAKADPESAAGGAAERSNDGLAAAGLPPIDRDPL